METRPAERAQTRHSTPPPTAHQPHKFGSPQRDKSSDLRRTVSLGGGGHPGIAQLMATASDATGVSLIPALHAAVTSFWRNDTKRNRCAVS
jgi:hypothetical protein